jgi:hypothetical protein
MADYIDEQLMTAVYVVLLTAHYLAMNLSNDVVFEYQ